MNKEEREIRSQMKLLIDLISQWNYEYYVLNKPSVSDSVYDQNYKLLRSIENQHRIILDNSPTMKVGFAPEKLTSSAVSLSLVRREKPMLSIDNVNNFKDLRKFDQKVKKEAGQNIQYVCELKIDGISISAIYEKGLIKQLSTRGDGFVGEDVTDNKSLISDLPQSILSQKKIEVRGEVYMLIEEFNLINEDLVKKGLKSLSNPRNAAAGSLRTLWSKNDVRARKLNFFSYQLFPSEDFKAQQECLEFLKKNNFQVSSYKICPSIDSVEEFIKEVESVRRSLSFLIDGVVVKVNDYSVCSKLGQTNKFPKWSIAYKFVSSEFSTTISEIISAVGKNGRLSYVALVKPFYLDGSLIRKVTLHNYAFIKNNFINISDEVLVKKSGDVIPQVSRVLKKNQSGYWIPQSFCPSCSLELEWSESNFYQICKNKFCTDKVISYLCFFVSKSAFNIKGISKSTIRKIYDQGILNEPSDFYELPEKRDILSKIFKDKTLNNIISSINRSKKQDLSRIISSFSIPLLSTYKAKMLSEYFSNNINTFFEEVKKIREKKENFYLEKILGKKTFESFNDYFCEHQNVVQLEKISKLVSTKD